jgi:hypothetical protein
MDYCWLNTFVWVDPRVAASAAVAILKMSL